jgi:hypothetical protein
MFWMFEQYPQQLFTCSAYVVLLSICCTAQAVTPFAQWQPHSVCHQEPDLLQAGLRGLCMANVPLDTKQFSLSVITVTLNLPVLHLCW